MSFFRSTQVAVNALYAEVKFTPYYSKFFLADDYTSLFFHLSRVLYDLATIAYRLLSSISCILNPFFWIFVPNEVVNLMDNLAGFAISVLIIPVHIAVCTIRTLNTVVNGFSENSDFGAADEGAERADHDLATTVW